MVFYYIFIYPFIWMYERIRIYFLCIHLPYSTGKPVAQMNPKLVREQNPSYWNHRVPLEINYQEYQKYSK